MKGSEIQVIITSWQCG